MNTDTPTHKVALITGGAKRIGKAICQILHANGYHIIIHYGQSRECANNLCDELNTIRPNSAKSIGFDFNNINNELLLNHFKNDCLALFGQMDCVIHNASSFYASDLTNDYQTLNNHWQDLFLTNSKAPFFISLLFKDELLKNQGNIISILDIHSDNKPYIGYPIYTMAKSAHRSMVQCLALEFAPYIRVNGVSPGVNVLPPHFSPNDCKQLKNSVPLNKIGEPADIASTVLFLLNSPYMTGQIISVDGGRSLTLKVG